MDFFNTNLFDFYGLGFAVLFLVPDIFYMRTHKVDRSVFDNRAMLYIDRAGKYCSVFLMAVNIGVLEKDFTSKLMKNFWLISTCVLTVVALLLWVLCFKRLSRPAAYSLTAVTSLIFILTGLLHIKTLLLTSGFVYLAGQLYVTNKYLKAVK